MLIRAVMRVCAFIFYQAPQVHVHSSTNNWVIQGSVVVQCDLVTALPTEQRGSTKRTTKDGENQQGNEEEEEEEEDRAQRALKTCKTSGKLR